MNCFFNSYFALISERSLLAKYSFFPSKHYWFHGRNLSVFLQFNSFSDSLFIRKVFFPLSCFNLFQLVFMTDIVLRYLVILRFLFLFKTEVKKLNCMSFSAPTSLRVKWSGWTVQLKSSSCQHRWPFPLVLNGLPREEFFSGGLEGEELIVSLLEAELGKMARSSSIQHECGQVIPSAMPLAHRPERVW